jgi:hypothetical protein
MSDQIPLPNVPALLITATGNESIDEALQGLDQLNNLDVTEHADIFATIHTKLSSALSDIDS